METPSYAILSRQSGLLNETRVVANNIANSATSGYRQQGLVFSEFVRGGLGTSSLSMARGQVRNTSQEQGVLTQTGGDFDLAIDGEGFFMLETPGGERLTRAGSFTPNAQGDLVNPDGYRLIDANGAPIFVPPDIDGVRIGPDGTISGAGRLLGQIGLFKPVDPHGLIREGGVFFRADDGTEPIEGASIMQGFLEGSNVNAIDQVARLVEVQRAYELGQSFLQAEDERIRNAVNSLLR
ncbi:flagellar hook-basal body complex protein [Ruegeria pomeroyi]|jgi:flagellar basal-body rod protein FlgF|uniref:Flagellar basal-body rod protein FlgF n=1 Tax=Ruegeria pomeroyi TaxID=89184 RepID=A0A850LF88_9RHOB|nr:flagellar hook-basal body complex protein [Ruegeria pomeroyi]NVK96568.1 flagellar hook-basal body complex protein [Ruegeria pomeroyi]NVL01593.1 flagellar hook-basal body complex protein [Ruegeria pomeroyi]QWV10797.1 flagellar hook-basal body complex protein [Ruegeria pomeroyi]HCE70473.1 flagellar basal-body rod protein FlgF [Ruegeria sp.]